MMENQEDNEAIKENATREFVHLMSVSHMNIYAYIVSIVGNSSDADDIMQETSAFMWERYTEFKSGTDFIKWGISIAYFKIKEFRKQQSRQQFSDEVMEKIHHGAEKNLMDANLYIEHLRHCLNKLSTSDLDLIKLRYESGNSVKKISLRVNTTVQAVYLKLSRIHGMLGRCVNQLIRGQSIL